MSKAKEVGSRIFAVIFSAILLATLGLSGCGGAGGANVDETRVAQTLPVGALVHDGPATPVGALVHDGPATPEQISLFLPVSGSLPQTATAVVRYKPTSSSTWVTGHPLYRIRPSLSLAADLGSVSDAFAWPIIDLNPGTSYDIEVTVNSGATTDVKTLTHTTRALPAPAGTPNKTITAGSSASMIQTAFNGLNPGDVIQFQNGTYDVSNLVLARSGTSGSPIYIRGQTKAGVILVNSGRVLQIQAANHVIIENMTMQGSGTDSGTSSSSAGIVFWDGAPGQTRITVRNILMTGVDSAIGSWAELYEFLAYDNTLTGNNTWTKQTTPGTYDIDTNLTWNDDGIRIPGLGNCAFNNTLRGFGDSMSFTQHSGGSGIAQAIGVHFYRNDVLMGGDDGAEVDYGQRNLTFYDNRIRNTMTFISLDPLYGGPFLAARNISINTGRTAFKWNSQNSGQFIYNNTIVSTTKRYAVTEPAAESAWYQPNNGAQESYGFRNNLMVYRGSGARTIRLDNTGHSIVDFDHNSWYPDLIFQWPTGAYANLATAYASLSASSPVFSGLTKRHEQDNITVSNPWTTTVTLGTDYHTEVTSANTPILSGGTAPKNSGVEIANITDDFSGASPDRGAIIGGRSIPLYGDRSPY